MKTWSVSKKLEEHTSVDDIIKILLTNRGIAKKQDQECFLHPPDPITVTPEGVGIDKKDMTGAVSRIRKAITEKESIVVYTDYDADGITGGAVLWEALHGLGANVMPYVPDRKEEGYGFSQKGLDTVKHTYDPTLIISVDHGITARQQVAYAKTLGIDVIVTDHHIKPKKLPDCPIVHTTLLSGAGVAWFLVKELYNQELGTKNKELILELLQLSAIGTIADMVPLIGANRSIARFGLEALKKTKRVGLLAILTDSGISRDQASSYIVSHMIAPRLNALGRLEHALDALRLLCTKNEARAKDLATRLGLTNKERQKLTIDASLHAKNEVVKIHGTVISKKLLFIAHESYNQGIIGLVAGKLVEEYYRPAIVLSKGETISKASARSISGFNIVEAIRSFSDLLIDVGGHPLAAGFTVETKNLPLLQEKLEAYAETYVTDAMLDRPFFIDMELPLSSVTELLWEHLRAFEPFGLGNYEPVFATRGVMIQDIRQIGADGKHLKLKVQDGQSSASRPLPSVFDAVAFGMGNRYSSLKPNEPIDIAYTVDMNEWNGTKSLQLKIKDIQINSDPKV